MAIERAYIAVAGPEGGGKTTIIERVLGDNDRNAVAVARCIVGPDVEELTQDPAKDDPEVCRYNEAGAFATARMRFPEDDTDAFWNSEFREGYYDTAIFEGSMPPGLDPDLRIFVCRPPDHPLYTQVHDDGVAAHKTRLALYERAQEEPELLADVLRESLAGEFGLIGGLGVNLEKILMAMIPDLRGHARQLAEEEAERGPQAQTSWRFTDGYGDLALAQVIVFNVQRPEDRERAEARVAEVQRIRKDDELFDDLIGWRGDRRPVTVRTVDLKEESGSQMTGLLRRIQRAFQ